MAARSVHPFRRLFFSSSFSKLSTSAPPSFRTILHGQETILASFDPLPVCNSSNSWWVFRSLSGSSRGGPSSPSSVRFVISEGKPKFEKYEFDSPKKEKWISKKKLKLQRKKEKQKRKSANRRNPSRLTIKGTKMKGKFSSAEERIEYKLEKAKVKEALLLERLKKYEVPKVQGPVVKPVELSGEERFYMKKMAQKRSNYVPVGRRGIFGGVILNMHMHWKKHETVKVICKPCKPGQLQEYADEIASLSGGIPIHIIGDDTIIFYRGKDYVQPKVLSPTNTLSRKKALEKSKYEQSLESVRHFIAIAEKELELYHRHIELYGKPTDQNPNTILNTPTESIGELEKVAAIDEEISLPSTNARSHQDPSDNVDASIDEELSADEDDYEDLSVSDLDDEGESSTEFDSCDEEI